MSENNEYPFQDLGLSPNLSKHLDSLGYKKPTPIQEQSIPVLLKGRDLLGQAQTGTGKTAAFALPLINNLNSKNKLPQILVLTPTRELAIQVYESFKTYAKDITNFRGVAIYGGASIVTQLKDLKRGAQVIVGTPGRVMDHLRRKTLDLSSLTTIVLDEADEMLKMGFVEDIDWILEHTPKSKQVALFSATMPDRIRKIAEKHLKDAFQIKIKSNTSTVKGIKQLYWKVQGINKLDGLSRVLDVEKIEAAIIFVRTKSTTVDLTEQLLARGYNAAALNGDLNQALREKTIEKLKNKKLDFIVATDVAARGIDVERVSHVINFDVPHDNESYVHRIGRTGRAGRKGTALLFVSPREMRILNSIERSTNQRIEEYDLPTKQAITQSRIANFKDMVRKLSKKDLAFYNTIIEEIESETELTSKNIASALCYLAQQEKPFILKEQATPIESRTEGSRKPRSNSRRGGSGREGRDFAGSSRRRGGNSIGGRRSTGGGRDSSMSRGRR
jgi:ATP-dependent RNA helicase DeaD